MPIKPPIFSPRGTAQERDNAYERERGSARARGYTPSWDKASKRFLCAHPLCLGCQAVGQIEPAVVTDHVRPHNGNQQLFWNEANWQPSCRWHHDVVKQQLEVMWSADKAKVADLRLDSRLAQEITRVKRAL